MTLPTRCNNVFKIYYSLFIWGSTHFGLHTAHHQEPKTALAASGFSHGEGCWTCRCWTLNVRQLHGQQTPTYAKPEAASAVLGSWWWAVCSPKHARLHINMKLNFDTFLHLAGFFMWLSACEVYSEQSGTRTGVCQVVQFSSVNITPLMLATYSSLSNFHESRCDQHLNGQSEN